MSVLPEMEILGTSRYGTIFRGYTAAQMLAFREEGIRAALASPDGLLWLYTHCRAIGMVCKSDSGKIEHDMALFTSQQKARIEELERSLASPDTAGWISVGDRLPPDNVKVLFWIRPKTADETYHNTSGQPILSTGKPHAELCRYKCWGSLWTATHWRHPDPPIQGPAAPQPPKGAI